MGRQALGKCLRSRGVREARERNWEAGVVRELGEASNATTYHMCTAQPRGEGGRGGCEAVGEGGAGRSGR